MNEDALGLQGVACGDHDRIVALPILQDRIEIHMEQPKALLEHNTGISTQKVVGGFVVVPVDLSRYAAPQHKFDIAWQRSVI